MPPVRIVLFRDSGGRVPIADWLDSLQTQAALKCIAKISRLRHAGHELRRPEADYVGNDMYELRAKHDRVNFRMLYFFHARTAAVIVHGFIKQQSAIAPTDLNLASKRKVMFEADPVQHGHPWKEDHGTT